LVVTLQDTDLLSVAVTLVTEVLALFVMACDAGSTPGDGSKPKRRPRPHTTDCQSVPHHVLWQKLDLHPSAPHRRSLDHLPFPVSDRPEADEPAVVAGFPAPRRRRRSAEPGSVSQSRTRRSHLAAYRRLVRRSLENDPAAAAAAAANSTAEDALGRRLRRPRRRLRPRGAVAAHQCRLERFWRRMSRGVFPPYVETGRCRQSTCLYGLYACERRRYALTILRRVPRRCNPLPTTTANATYEQVWRFAELHVTVGCECARKQRPGRVDFVAGAATTSSPPLR